MYVTLFSRIFLICVHSILLDVSRVSSEKKCWQMVERVRLWGELFAFIIAFEKLFNLLWNLKIKNFYTIIIFKWSLVCNLQTSL